MLEKYRTVANEILSKAKSSNLSECVLSLELTLSDSSETLSSTLLCKCSKKSYEQFMESLSPEVSLEVVPDYSLSCGDICPNLLVNCFTTEETPQLQWEKPCYCVFIWGSWSPNSGKLLKIVEEVSKKASEIEIFSIGLNSQSQINIDGVKEFYVNDFSGVTDQGLEISEIPCILLLKNSRIYAKLDLLDDIINKINELIAGVPCKVSPEPGKIIESLSLRSGVLNLNDNCFHLILFPSTEDDYFLRHLLQIQDENPEWAEMLQVTVIEKSDLPVLEVVSDPGVFLIVHKTEILLKGDSSCTDIFHMLKNLINPTVFTRDQFLEKKSRLEYSQSLWEQKYSACPAPKVIFKFTQKVLFFSRSYEEKVAFLEGKFLTVHEEYVNEFFEILSGFFPNAFNNAEFEAPSHTISPGEQCSICDELLEKTHFLCVYCKPAQYFCEKCDHAHPVFRFTNDTALNDRLAWGAFNLNLGRIEGGIHLDVICNICKEKISGIRWKCAVCSDFDCCSDCLRESAKHPKEHIMIRIPS